MKIILALLVAVSLTACNPDKWGNGGYATKIIDRSPGATAVYYPQPGSVKIDEVTFYVTFKDATTGNVVSLRSYQIDY